MNKYAMILDAKPSMRTVDDNGFLHVALTPISKATVNPYLGSEIEGSKEHGFAPDKILFGLRDPAELEKSAKTFDGLPLLLEHHPTDAENMPKEWVVGSVGTDATYEYPYLKNSLTITDAQAIKYVEDGVAQEISCSYRFTPEFKSGEFTEADGSKVHYDFIMRDIRGNHVALVPQGRAGHDVRVADSISAVNDIGKKLDERRNDFMPNKKEVPLAKDELTAEEETFAEGVKKGEELEKEEPKKLDSEHESEGMKKELGEDACGKDEELPVDEANLDELLKDPKNKAIFEMGVRYGEKREKADPERIDADHEREGMEKALGEDSIKKIQDSVMAKVRAINGASRKVRPLVGEIADPLAFDSAESIYKFALEKSGKDVSRYPEVAFEGMVDMLLDGKHNFVADSKPVADVNDEYIAMLNKIRK